MNRPKLAGYQLAGAERIDEALRAGTAIQLLLVREGAKQQASLSILERARVLKIPVREASESAMRRMSAVSPAAEILALVGRMPDAALDELFEKDGALWLLVDVAYPGNVGMAIRTAEVSGADGVVVDAGFDHDGRRNALRASVRADWFMPVLWERAKVVLECAEKQRRRVVGVEVIGTRAPWEEDLTGPVLFVVGGEMNGVPDWVLERCDAVLRIPMRGFIPAYNLQAAVSAVAIERVRQLEVNKPISPPPRR